MIFIIFGSKEDYGKVRMNDILDESNVLYIPPVLYKANKLKELLYKFHNSFKVNKYINLPYKSIWYSSYYDTRFMEDIGEICFIFEEYSPIPYNEGFLKHLRDKYPLAKLVFLFSNTINVNLMQKLDYLKDMFDLLLTFDKHDAKKYNVQYYPTYYSRLPLTEEDNKQIDVFFIGAEKGRLQTLLGVYDTLKESGLSCDFNIVGVDEKQKKYEDEITYNRRLTYMEVLKRIKNSKCILEVMQMGQVGTTLRAMEAIAYNKKLLTNNRLILEEPFFQQEYISVFDDYNNIDIDFLKGEIDNIDYQYIEYLSPKKLLAFLERYFRQNI